MPKPTRNRSATTGNRSATTRMHTDRGALDLSISGERTLGSIGGIQADVSVEVGIDGVLKGAVPPHLSIDAANRSASFGVGVGARKLKGGVELGGNIKLKEDGSIESIGGNIGGNIAGFGGGISADSEGAASIALEAFGGKIQVARDKDGNATLQICYGIGIVEVCSTFSRDTGDRNDGSLGGAISSRPGGTKSRPQRRPRPQRPITPVVQRRPRPQRRPKPPKPRDARPPVDRPIDLSDKKPTLDTKKSKKQPIDIRKKPLIDLRKKKQPIDIRKKPPIDLKKKPPVNIKKRPSPINLKKPPIPPKPLPIPPPKKPSRPIPPPTPTPTPKPPKPSPSPSPSPPPVPRPAPKPKPGSKITGKSCKDGNWVLCGHLYNNLADSLKLWLEDYIFYSDYAPGKSGTFEQRRIGDEAQNERDWGTKGGWSKEIRTIPWGLEALGGWVFKHSKHGFVSDPPAVEKAITIRKRAKRIFYYPNSWAIWGYPNKELAGYESGPFDHELEVVSTTAPPPCPDGQTGIELSDEPPIPPPVPRPAPKPPNKPSPRLPNKPTQIKPKPMAECCDKINDIYKYLGIAKIKKNKFAVSKAFLVAGGKGNEECEDYYQLNQALFRMLANGLILNPKSSPLGSEWTSVNATAWAGQLYEMAAESMSDGNSSQKYEISMMMQITQLLSIIAELSRKVEFLIDATGFDPQLESERINACFTIYEGHEGFEKKSAKKIDASKAKSDDEVEAVLAKMLKPSKIPIVKWVLKPGTKTIVQLLMD